MHFLSRDLSHPVQKLVVLFVCWKLLLLLVASGSPGPGYDTSTSLVEADHRKELPVILRHLVSKLVRWDAVYYVKVAERYYLFEQEWAFGWGFTRAIAFFTECKFFTRISTSITEKYRFEECRSRALRRAGSSCRY